MKAEMREEYYDVNNNSITSWQANDPAPRNEFLYGDFVSSLLSWRDNGRDPVVRDRM